MTDLLQQIRDRLTCTPDTVCLERAHLVTEAWARFEREPPPLRRARCFAHVLRHMTLDLDSNPFFAGNTSSRPRAWMLIPEHGFRVDAQAEIEHEDLRGFLDGKIPPDLLAFWEERSIGGHCGIGHLAVDLDLVVHRGLEHVLAEVQSHDGDTEEQAVYREAMAVSLQAVLDWAARYADAAQEAADRAADPALAAAHRRVAAACRHVPAKPARDLFEGLQAIALVHLAIALEGHGMSVSIGLPDRVLERFVGEHSNADEAADLIAAFLLKIAANSVCGKASKTQAITVGGADHTGRDRSNALTLCFLEAANRVRLGDPHVFLRWHDALDPAVKRRAAELLASGLSMPLLINDAATARGFEQLGIAPEDAWGYCVIGCNELGIPGRCMSTATAVAGTVQYLGLLNETLLGCPHPDEVSGMDDLLARLEAVVRRRLAEMRTRGERWWGHMAQVAPTPFTSALMRGCVERGEDLLTGMQYRNPGLYERGLTNAANALAAIEEVVFRRRTRSLCELVAQMRDNFPNEATRQALMRAPKWGNDDDRVDRWALELVRMRERVLDDLDREAGSPPHTVCHVVRSLHHLDGRGIAASPDGRLEKQPVADSIGAQTGTARQGPTGILGSVLKLDAARYYRGGYNLNLTLPRDDTTPECILGLVAGFFSEGGQELQINCLDARTLREAQAHPERHRDLVVRVAGLSARFIELSRVEQEELIARANALP